jgi:hypothetical protein
MSDEPLPPPPDVLAYGEFTLSLRSVLNGTSSRSACEAFSRGNGWFGLHTTAR